MPRLGARGVQQKHRQEKRRLLARAVMKAGRDNLASEEAARAVVGTVRAVAERGVSARGAAVRAVVKAAEEDVVAAAAQAMAAAAIGAVAGRRAV